MFLWGKSGHIQSVLFSVVGRFGQKEPIQKRRVEIAANDGLIISYDMFHKDPNVKAKHVRPFLPTHFLHYSVTLFIMKSVVLKNKIFRNIEKPIYCI